MDTLREHPIEVTMSVDDTGVPAPLERVARRLGPLGGLLLMLPVAAAVLPLGAVSALTRWLSRQRCLEPSSLPWQELIQFEPVVGARTRANLKTYGRAEDVFRLTTDAEGWRGQTPMDEADVVVFGDSFAFGHGVDDNKIYAELTPDMKVKPIASDAYSMVHSLLWMRRLASRIGGKTIVWFVYCGNDLADNLSPNHWGYRMPFVKHDSEGHWEIVTDHVSTEPWTFRPPPGRANPERLYAELCTPSRYSERAFSAANFLIGEAAHLARGIDARLGVWSIPLTAQVRNPGRVKRLASDPAQVDLDAPDRQLERSCREHGVPFLPLLPEMKASHYLRQDMHWNPSGHRLIAETLAEFYRNPDSPHFDYGERRLSGN